MVRRAYGKQFMTSYPPRSLSILSKFKGPHHPATFIIPNQLFHKSFEVFMCKYKSVLSITTQMEIQMELAKTPSQTTEANNSHMLTIKRTDLSQSQEIKAIFAPMPINYPLTLAAPDRDTISSTPGFNNDRLYFTPAFMLEVDQLRMKINSENIRMFQKLHLAKIAECCEEEGGVDEDGEERVIQVSRPADSRFCHVCKNAYDDYLTHVRMPYHTSNIQKNKFWTDINKLCQKFNPLEQKQKKAKTKNIKKSPNRKNKKEVKQQELQNTDTTITSIEVKV